jgi:hypothetical protein
VEPEVKFHRFGFPCDEYAPARHSDWRPYSFLVYASEAMQETANDSGVERRAGIFGLTRYLGSTSLLLALLQSLCTAVLTISGIRVAIGLTALAAASGIYAPATGFHQDAIRIPMLTIAAVGAIVNLAVLAWIWHLRARPSAQWRKREISRKERRSERLQVALAILTLVLVGLETWTHTIVHRTGPPPAGHSVSKV